MRTLDENEDKTKVMECKDILSAFDAQMKALREAWGPERFDKAWKNVTKPDKEKA